MSEEGKGKGKGLISHVFHGIRWPAPVHSCEQLDALKALPCRDDDVFVATYPKAGTHWVHKLCQLILDQDTVIMFPMEFNTWEKGPAWAGKGKGKGKDSEDMPHDAMPAPRIMATHVPLSFLPADAEHKSCRIVYVVRDPKDLLVSYFHFSNSNPFVADEPDLAEFVDKFVAGADLDITKATQDGAVLGGYASHVHAYAAAAKAGRNIYVVSYDRMQAAPEHEIDILAKFLGRSLTSDQISDVRARASFKSMQEEAKNKEARVAKGEINGGLGPDGKVLEWSSILFRKGETGDGAATLSAEQSVRVDNAFGEVFAPIKDIF